MPDDLVADYLWLGLACGSFGFDVPDRSDRPAILGAALDVPLIRFKNASSCTLERPDLLALAEADPRFVETQYLLGISAFATQLMTGADEAETRFQTAYAWRSNWPRPGSLSAPQASGIPEQSIHSPVGKNVLWASWRAYISLPQRRGDSSTTRKEET